MCRVEERIECFAYIVSISFNIIKKTAYSLLDLQNSGKNIFVNVLATGQFENDQIPTIGFNFRELTKGKVNFKMWDLGGHPRFRDSLEKCCPSTSCLIFPKDRCRSRKLWYVKNTIITVIKWLSFAGVPLLFLGNKNDDSGALDEN